MRGLGGSEQLFLLRHSEVSSCIIDNIIYGCIPKSFRATLLRLWVLCSESEVEDIMITGGVSGDLTVDRRHRIVTPVL